jgi:hypothetical protein
MALNFGPPAMTFEALGSLGKTFQDAQAAAQKRAIDQQKQQLLAGLGQGSGDYQKVGLGLIGAGDVQSGVALLGLAQKDREQKLAEEAYKTSPFSSSVAPRAPGAPTVPLGSDPRASLIQNESGGRWNAQNDAVGAGGKVGHFGRLQFGQARLQEAAAAGAIPPGTTPEQFMQSPELQQAAERWHFSDIDQNIKANGFDRLVGQPINGVPVTVDGLRAVAHLGGVEGMKRFVQTGGRYNPADRNGTRLSDYFARHGGSAPAQPAPVQVAENEADVQRLEAQMPGYGGAPVQIAQAPAQPGAPVADAVAPGAQPVQGFVVPPGQAGKLPENDPFPQVTNDQLISVIRNPRSAPGDKALAQQLFASRQAYASETAPEKREQARLETRRKQLEIDKLERDAKTPEAVREFVWARQNGYTTARNPVEYAREKTKTTPGEEVDQRKDAAARAGVTPTDPRYQSYVLTGKTPREDAQPLSATDKKAILEADEGVLAGETAIRALNEAKALSKQAMSGPTAGARAAVGNNLPDWAVPDFIASPGAAEATTNLENTVTAQALAQMKSIFGAAPTEGERKILLDIQGSINQPDNVRQKIYDRAIKAAEARLTFNKQRAGELRGGDYYKAPGARQGGVQSQAQPAQPQGVPQGARQAPDGNFYVPDPSRPGKFLMVQP